MLSSTSRAKKTITLFEASQSSKALPTQPRVRSTSLQQSHHKSQPAPHTYIQLILSPSALDLSFRRRHGVSPCSVAWRRCAASRRAVGGSRQVACLYTTPLPSGAASINSGLRASSIQAHVFFDANCCCNYCRCPSLDTGASGCAVELYSPLAESVFPGTWDAKSVLWPESF